MSNVNKSMIRHKLNLHFYENKQKQMERLNDSLVALPTNVPDELREVEIDRETLQCRYIKSQCNQVIIMIS